MTDPWEPSARAFCPARRNHAPGDTLIVALLGQVRHLRSEFGDGVRAGFCLMGACQDCWVYTVEGERMRACATVRYRHDQHAHRALPYRSLRRGAGHNPARNRHHLIRQRAANIISMQIAETLPNALDDGVELAEPRGCRSI